MHNNVSLASRLELAFALLAFPWGAVVLLLPPILMHGRAAGAWGALLYDLFFLVPLAGITMGGWSHVVFGYGLTLLGMSWLALLLTIDLWHLTPLVPSLLLGVATVLVAAFRASAWGKA